ncbi:hypothetical protein EVAR_84525_1 [Eumeta japonica]|uniref:Uncharacterized protein n=1 Tax=Eumeta variegata TaxID=151549 RepID=A0A4C1UJ39_EUMVA|nr:hypothetical protein EVAR_84525_1 [Eumeta japonica]
MPIKSSVDVVAIPSSTCMALVAPTAGIPTGAVADLIERLHPIISSAVITRHRLGTAPPAERESNAVAGILKMQHAHAFFDAPGLDRQRENN